MKVHLGFMCRRANPKGLQDLHASATIEGDAWLIEEIIKILKEKGFKVSWVLDSAPE